MNDEVGLCENFGLQSYDSWLMHPILTSDHAMPLQTLWKWGFTLFAMLTANAFAHGVTLKISHYCDVWRSQSSCTGPYIRMLRATRFVLHSSRSLLQRLPL